MDPPPSPGLSDLTLFLASSHPGSISYLTLQQNVSRPHIGPFSTHAFPLLLLLRVLPLVNFPTNPVVHSHWSLSEQSLFISFPFRRSTSWLPSTPTSSTISSVPIQAIHFAPFSHLRVYIWVDPKQDLNRLPRNLAGLCDMLQVELRVHVDQHPHLRSQH